MKSKKRVCNDTSNVVINLMNDLKLIDSGKAVTMLESTISKYNLSKTNEEGYKKIRKDYNKGDKTWYMFYSMLTHAFNYQISFNKSLEKNFIKFVDRLNNLNIEFLNKNFSELKIDNLANEDFVYCDPPYLITSANYNKSAKWNEEKERELLNLLDKLNEKGISFALSNVLESKGNSNDILKEWSKKYNIHYLNYSYANFNYCKKDKSNNTIEVLITNYT